MEILAAIQPKEYKGNAYFAGALHLTDKMHIKVKVRLMRQEADPAWSGDLPPSPASLSCQEPCPCLVLSLRQPRNCKLPALDPGASAADQTRSSTV